MPLIQINQAGIEALAIGNASSVSAINDQGQLTLDASLRQNNSVTVFTLELFVILGK